MCKLLLCGLSFFSRTSRPCYAEMYRADAPRTAEPSGAYVQFWSALTHHPNTAVLWGPSAWIVEASRVPHPLTELLHQGDGQR